MKINEKSYKWASALEKRKKTDTIILHHAEASKCTADDIHKWHLENGWAGIAYHFFVRKDGTIYRGRPVDTVGAHACGANATSIGICFEGSYNKEQMPAAQKKAGTELVCYLREEYNISKVLAHRDVGNTDCPGKNFPFAEIASGKVATASSAADKCSVTVRQLSENHRGNDVRLVQQALIARGYSCGKSGADGIFGTGTRNALKKFQTANKLTEDGICGTKTWAKLLAE